MNIQLQEIKGHLKNSTWIGFSLLILIAIGSGCATTHKTTVTETSLEYPNKENPKVEEVSTPAAVILVDQNPEVIETSKTTTTTTTDTGSQHTSIMGGIFHVIGSVISFPFVVIGGLFRMIF